jgi:hypothetical protein
MVRWFGLIQPGNIHKKTRRMIESVKRCASGRLMAFDASMLCRSGSEKSTVHPGGRVVWLVAIVLPCSRSVEGAGAVDPGVAPHTDTSERPPGFVRR